VTDTNVFALVQPGTPLRQVAVPNRRAGRHRCACSGAPLSATIEVSSNLY
jgi:hypothetical protein